MKMQCLNFFICRVASFMYYLLKQPSPMCINVPNFIVKMNSIISHFDVVEAGVLEVSFRESIKKKYQGGMDKLKRSCTLCSWWTQTQ